MKLFNYTLLLVSSLVVATSFAAAPAPDCGTNRAILTAATQLGVPPYNELNAAGTTISGFDVRIVCELRKRLGFGSVRFMQGTRGSAELTSGLSTIVISPLNEINPITLATATSNEALIKYADFAHGLLFNGPVPAGVTTVNALQTLVTAEARFGVIASSFELGLLGVFANPTALIVPFATVDLALAALTAGDIDVFFLNNVVVDTAAAETAAFTALDNVLLPAGEAFAPYRSTGIAIGVNPTCCQLYVDIRQALADMVADGTYARLARETAPTIPTDFTPGPDRTPAACATTTPRLVVRNDISNFIFDKFCACNPTVIPVTP